MIILIVTLAVVCVLWPLSVLLALGVGRQVGYRDGRSDERNGVHAVAVLRIPKAPKEARRGHDR